jgi:hypothetical protein
VAGVPETKGSAFISAVSALKKMAPDRFEKFLETLSPEAAALMRRPPLPVTWVPADHWFAILEAAHKHLFDGDETKMFEFGRLTLLSDLKTIYRFFIRFMSPQFVIDRAAKLWETYTRNSGHLVAKPVGEKSCDVFYKDLPKKGMSAAYWAYQRGCVAAAIEATGMKNIQVVLLAGGGTNNQAILRCSWG